MNAVLIRRFLVVALVVGVVAGLGQFLADSTALPGWFASVALYGAMAVGILWFVRQRERDRR